MKHGARSVRAAHCPTMVTEARRMAVPASNAPPGSVAGCDQRPSARRSRLTNPATRPGRPRPCLRASSASSRASPRELAASASSLWRSSSTMNATTFLRGSAGPDRVTSTSASHLGCGTTSCQWPSVMSGHRRQPRWTAPRGVELGSVRAVSGEMTTRGRLTCPAGRIPYTPLTRGCRIGGPGDGARRVVDASGELASSAVECWYAA